QYRLHGTGTCACRAGRQGLRADRADLLLRLFGPFAQPWAATAVLMASLPPALNVFVIARQNDTWIEPASVAVLIGTFASVVTLTSAMWLSGPVGWRFLEGRSRAPGRR